MIKIATKLKFVFKWRQPFVKKTPEKAD